MTRRPDRVLRTLSRALRVSARSGPVLGRGYLGRVRRAFRLIGQDLFTAEEILRLGLLDPALAAEDQRGFLSRRAMTLIEQRLNPIAWRILVEDKGIFYRTCAAHGLATPQLCGLYLGDRPGWTSREPTPESREQWAEFLELVCPADLVIKPACGAYGSGVRVLTRTPERQFVDHTGRACHAVDLIDQMRAGAGARGWVIQARIWNHPTLMRLSGSPYLQCARLLTLTDRQGRCHLLHSHLKVIIGQNIVDNFHHGATGNVTAMIDPRQGALRAAVTVNPHGAGFRTLAEHPATGASIEGFELPFWDEACQLAREAARVFLPLRLVGWDIALTATGPVLVEANWNPDPPNPHRNLHRLREAFERLA